VVGGGVRSCGCACMAKVEQVKHLQIWALRLLVAGEVAELNGKGTESWQGRRQRWFGRWVGLRSAGWAALRSGIGYFGWVILLFLVVEGGDTGAIAGGVLQAGTDAVWTGIGALCPMAVSWWEECNTATLIPMGTVGLSILVCLQFVLHEPWPTGMCWYWCC
jgi:hypothetical protein